MDNIALKNFINENYTVVSNVARVEEAEVICLGESHGNNKHRKNNAFVIDSLFNEFLITLVEWSDKIKTDEYRKLPVHFQQTFYVKRPIEIKGWDLVPRNFKYPINKIAITGLVSIVASMKIGLLNSWNLFSTLSMCLVVRSLLNTFALEIAARNQNMCRHIEANLTSLRHPSRRVVVLGGKGHFRIPNSRLEKIVDFVYLKTEAFKSYNQAITDTLAYLNTKKFAILIPK